MSKKEKIFPRGDLINVARSLNSKWALSPPISLKLETNRLQEEIRLIAEDLQETDKSDLSIKTFQILKHLKDE